MINVVLVEDSRHVRESLRQMLSEIPGVVVSGEFEAAQTAIEGIDRLRPQLVIVDIGLQSGSGLDVLSHVRWVHPRTKSIVFSDRAGAEYRRRASRLGAMYSFSKVGETEKLYDAVAALSASAMSLGSA